MNDDKVIERIQQLESEQGELTAHQVLDDARSPDSPLHRYFDWDDSEAAEKWRLSQARTLIRNIRIVRRVEKRTIPVFAYVRDPDRKGNEPGYRSTVRLANHKDRARDSLNDEFKRAEAALERAVQVAESLGLHGELKDLMLGLERFVTRLLEEKPEPVGILRLRGASKVRT